MRYFLTFLSLVASIALWRAPAPAGSSLIGTWACRPLSGGDASDVQVATFTSDGKVSAKTSDGSMTAKYTYSGGVLTETVQGVDVKSKLVWKGADAFNLIVSDPDTTSRACTRKQ